MSNLIEQRDVVVATVEELKAKLGEAITSGNEKARAKASADLAEGQRVVAELNTAIGAVEASEAAAARRAEQEEQRRRDAELQANLKAANADLAGLKTKAEAVDAALAAALDAASDLKAAGAAYQSKHAGLNIHPAAMVWLQSPMRGLEEAIKAQPSLAGRVPDMNFIFTGARPHKSKEEKLKALGPFAVAQIKRRRQERIKNGLEA